MHAIKAAFERILRFLPKNPFRKIQHGTKASSTICMCLRSSFLATPQKLLFHLIAKTNTHYFQTVLGNSGLYNRADYGV
jgi:hypothetical protein